MKLSVIIPAFNEEKLLPSCLAHAHAALQAHAAPDWSYELIVCDNNSSDRTAELARAGGAQVVFEPINQISRARNAGARLASGDWLLFIDADSLLHPATVGELLDRIRGGRCAGGGCLVTLDEMPPLGILLELWTMLSRMLRWAAGSFVFCRTDAFRAVGGFSTDLYAAEEVQFSEKLKGWARQRGLKVVILGRQRHVSSGRKFRLYSRGTMGRLFFDAVIRRRTTLGNKERLAVFYDGRR